MNCPKCGTTIADGATFCGHCGANLAAESATGSSEAKPADRLHVPTLPLPG